MRLIADSNGIDSYSLLTLRGVGKMRPVRLVRLGASVSSNMTIGQTSALMSRAFSLLLTLRDFSAVGSAKYLSVRKFIFIIVINW